MLVRVQPGERSGANGLEESEEAVLRVFRDWEAAGADGPRGVAFFNVDVPGRNQEPRQTDAVLFTPSGIVAVEIKGLRRRQDGELYVPTNGPWRIGEENAAVYSLKLEETPGRQCRGRAMDLANALSTVTGIKRYVRGLVIICRGDSDLTLGDTTRAGKGIGVAVDTPDSIGQVLSGFAKTGKGCTAQGALDAILELELDYLAPEFADLVGEQFPLALPPKRTRRRPRRSTSTGRRSTPLHSPSPGLAVPANPAVDVPPQEPAPRLAPGDRPAGNYAVPAGPEPPPTSSTSVTDRPPRPQPKASPVQKRSWWRDGIEYVGAKTWKAVTELPNLLEYLLVGIGWVLVGVVWALGQALRIALVAVWWLFAGSSPLWWRMAVLLLAAFVVSGAAKDVLPG